MSDNTGTRTGATVVLLTLLAVGVLVGTGPAAAETTDEGPGFDFEDDGSFGFDFGDSDGNDSDAPAFDFGGSDADGAPAFDFGGGADDGSPDFDFGGGDADEGPAFDFGGGADTGAPTFGFGDSGDPPEFDFDGDDGTGDDGNETDGSDRPTAAFVPSITGTNSPVTAGESVTVTATVENTGAGDGQQTVTLTVGEMVRDSQQVALSAGEARTVTFAWDTAAGDAGTYTATVATANDTSAASVTVENGSDGDDAVLPFRPSAFEAYVQGETAYLHSGVNDGSFPIEFTECSDFQPTDAARAENPDYLPLDECIRLNGTVDDETDTWTGELDFPRITGAIRDTRAIGDVYYAAEIETTEPITGTFDLSTGEITGQTAIRLNLTVWNVDEVGVPWDQRLASEESPPLTNETCHIPATEVRLSTEKEFAADSPVAASDVMAGARLNDANETQVVTDDFAVESAEGCGEIFDVNVDREINHELGIPADPGESELVLDFALDLER